MADFWESDSVASPAPAPATAASTPSTSASATPANFWEADKVAPAAGKNFWEADQVAPKQNTSWLGDIGTSLKRGVEELPGMVTGILDIPPALVFNERPYTEMANAIGKATGIEPGKWAEHAQGEYSPQAHQAQKEIADTWNDPNHSWGDVVKQYATNPSYVAQQVAESLPSMVAGGAIGKGALWGGELIEGGAGMLERAFGEKLAAPVAAGIGEGTVQAGQQMQQGEGLADQRKNAIASIGSGVVDAIIGAGAGRVAHGLGLETAEMALVKGFNRTVEKELSLGRRIGGGAISEGVLQELPQSAQEQVWQNYAEGKPLWDGVPRQAVEGMLAGFAMGSAANVRGGNTIVATPTPGTESATTPGAAPLALPNRPHDTMYVFSDGSTGTQSQIDQHLAALPEENRAHALATMMYGAHTPDEVLEPKGTPLSLPNRPYNTMYVFSDGSTGTQHMIDTHLNSLPEEQRPAALSAMMYGAHIIPRATVASETTPMPATQAVPHPNAAPGSLSSAVNIAAERGAISAAPAPTAPAAQPVAQETTNAIRQPSTSSILQHAPGGTGEAGSERGRVEQGIQGAEIAKTSEIEPTRAETGSAATTAQSVAALRPHIETLLNRRKIATQIAPRGNFSEIVNKAKQAMVTGQGKSLDFAKAANTFKDDPQIKTALMAIAAHVKQTTTAPTVAEKAPSRMAVGKTALNAEPITVRNGVVHIGDEPAVNYETGEDVNVAADAKPEEIRAALVHSGAIAKGHRIFGAGKAEKVVYSRASSAAHSFARNVLSELAEASPEIFRHSVTTATTLDGALADILPGVQEETNKKLTYPKNDQTVTRRTFVTADGKISFNVFESTDGTIYLDIGKSTPGAGGGAVYAALGDYARNTGKKFIGDPAGLSPDALIRRTAQMLFSAIRHGTTEHLGASKEQAEGDPEHGVPPLIWGNKDVDNFANLAQTYIDTIVNHVPEITNVRYDFDKQGFYNAGDGRPVTEADFKRTGQSRGGREAKAGSGSLRTASLLQSLLRLAEESPGERGRVLSAILNGKVVHGLEAMLSRDSETLLPKSPHSIKTATTALLAAHTGRDRAALQTLLDRGAVRIVTSEQAHNLLGDALNSSDGLARAFYSPSNTTTYFIADHLDKRTDSPADLRALVRHEIAVHAFQLGKGNKEFNDILRQLDMMKRAGNTAVRDAYAAVPRDTPVENLSEEALAYLVQHSPELGIVQRVVAWFRNALRAMGLKTWAGALSVNDILHMAQSAMRTGSAVERERGFAPMFERTDTSYGALNDAQAAAINRIVGKPKTLLDRAKEFRTNWRKSLEQGIFDQYAPIKDVSQSGYVKARMSKSGDSTLEAVFMYGKPYLDENGDIKVEFDSANKGMNGFASVLSKLDGEHDRFLLWVAALRAESLKAIGLENLWSHGDIATLKTLNRDKLQNGESREAAYATALKEMMAYNNSVLSIAQKRGLISEETRKMYETTPYVPFYRLADEGAVQGFTAQSGMVNQYAWKKLTGGTNKLNEDLLANMLQNWSHLITASARNDAAKTTLEDAVRVGAAEEIPSGVSVKGAVSFREGSKERQFVISDPHLVDAITSLGAVVRVPAAMRMFKHYLTLGVTVNPAFKIRNLMRDTIQSMALADLSLNPAKNIRQGIALTHEASETRAQMLAAGGIIRFGSMLQGDSADMGRELVEKMGVPKDHILDDAGKIEKFWKHTVKPAFDVYQEMGDRGEQINRAALYDQLIKKGISHGEAAYWARDLMDFSMSGKWTAIRFVTQTVPFFNARLQGLYKLGRAAQADKKRFAVVLGSVTMASLALLAAYHDDDDWKKREDWDRDNYWWFKIGGKAFYIPKPFEIGAIATVAERTAELMTDNEMTGKRFGDELFNIVNNQLSMNPTPQLVKPLIDMWANKDGFTGKPIETMGMERLQPEDRYKQTTSGTARVLSQLGLPDPTKLAMGNYSQMSPVQIDYLIRAYFSWVGSSATTVLDYGIFHPLMDKTARPAMQIQDVFLAGNFVKDLPAGSSRYVTQMYNQAKEIEQAYASYRAAIQAGDKQRAASLLESEGEKIRQYHHVEAVKRMESQWSARARMIERSNLDADAKRAALNKIESERDALARRISPS